MGGIGKTTLARRTYEDSLRSQYFDILAWTTVSGEYRRRDALLQLLQSFKKYTTDSNERSGESEAQLAKLVYQNLIGRRYLIVIDDIWTTEAWDDLKMVFPDDGNGSRILLTTRLSEVAVYAGSSSTPIHQMKFLNEDQSWKLLEEKIFGKESCPLHLVELGKEVARNCKGLPLTIVVVAGLLLSSGNTMEEESWESILENISSIESTISAQCSKILCLSYDWLPLRLKPCFLYIAGFPEDSEIVVSELIMLWVAEGFLKPSSQSKCLEDVGKGCLEDLVNRNLILVSKKGPDGELVAVGIHDLLRKICMTKAEEDGFFHHVSSTRNVWNDDIENPKSRLRAHSAHILDESETQDSSVRSIFYQTENIMERWNFSTPSPKFRHLSVLNTPSVIWLDLSREISAFVNLSLKKLTLREVPFPWENMNIIGSLPDLQVLKIVENGIERNSEWTTMEGQFLRLKHFYSSLDYLVKWEVEKDHLPSLETLILENVRLIDEIPHGIGDIDSLLLVELLLCRESLVNSAMRIQERQHENGNYAFQVSLFNPEHMNHFY
ncbi:putative late blight resistance protein homolog R1B-16 [Primulina tabacum]|uniref:putative late blight resistance protein homolog R1B-16 n=1 Tax=Primulina tabacum TaxID=48773 RepID=UPI003F5A41E4